VEVLVPEGSRRVARLEDCVSKKRNQFMRQIGRGIPQTTLDKISKPVPEKSGTGTKTKKRDQLLTTQEWKFVNEFVSGDGHVTAREAVLRAGYPEKRAKYYAETLTDPNINPHIVAEIQKLRTELSEKYGTTYERHMRDLQLIRDQALSAGAYGAAVQAEYRRGQALGTIYIDRKEIRHGTIDSMSKEEVMRKLEEIKKLYGNGSPIIDVTPQQVEQSIEEDDEPIAEAEIEEIEEDESASETRDETVSAPERKPPKLPYYPD
jgi:phage terminase small subunit